MIKLGRKTMSQKRKTKRNLKADAIFKLLAFVYAVISIIFYIAVIKMDLLPGIYVTIFTMAVGVLTVAMVVGNYNNYYISSIYLCN